MKVWLWIGGALVLLLVATLAMLNRASGSWIDGEQVRLGLPNTDPAQPPKGMFHQLMDHDGAHGRLKVSYRHEPVGQGQGQHAEVLVISFDNQASQVTNYNLFLASRPSDITPGQRHRLTARVSASPGVQDPLFLGLGFQLYQRNGAYLSDVSPADGLFKAVLGEAQPLQADWVGGEAEAQTGEVPASLLPRLSLYNIPPGFKGEVRLQGPAMVVLGKEEAAARAAGAGAGAGATPDDAGMYIGHAFHRYPGASEKAFGPLTVRYQFARSLANDLTYLNQWWTGEDRYDWRGIDRWANFHAGPGQRRLLITFSGSPQWASQAPEQYAAMGQPGNAAPPKRHLLPAYQRMVKETVARYKGRLLAVECWNEPNSRDFFSGTPTELADLCQAVYEGSKAAAPEVPVICPQADSPENMGFVYEARTSGGESILKRCDVLGAHIYNRLGRDAHGHSYSAQRLEDSVRLMRRVAQRHGVAHKQLAVTEFGVSSCVTQPTRQHPLSFGRMGSPEAGEALYQTLRGFRELGVWMVALYSFDHEDNDPQCRPGGFTRMMRSEGGRQRVDEAVVKRLNDAVTDFGHREGVSTR